AITWWPVPAGEQDSSATVCVQPQCREPAPNRMIASMALPDWSPVLSPSGQSPETNSDRLDRENAALRELVTVYRYLSGLALQDADLAGVVGLISDRMTATVAVVTQLMDVLTAAAPRVAADKAAAAVREHVVHPRLGQVLRASRLSQRAPRLPNLGGGPAHLLAPIVGVGQ